MPKVRHSKAWTESDALTEVVGADPLDFVLETSPPDYVEKISRFLQSSSVGQGGRDGAAEDPGETDSDSSDSLFITQKPVPEAVRSARRQRHSLRSGPTSPRFQEESEDDSSPSVSPQQSRGNKDKKKAKFRLPKYSFPFLKERNLKASTTLRALQNIRLHYSAMGGFFECVRKQQESYQTGEDLESYLLAVDMDGERISPISEGEEEKVEDGDMKVVAKKHFVVPSKAKHSRPWYTENKRDGEVIQRKRPINAGGNTSKGRFKKMLHEIPVKTPSVRTALSSDLESSDDEDCSYRILGEKERSDKQQTGDRSVLAQSQTPKSKRRLNRGKKDNSEQNEKEDELCVDSSAPLCEQSPKECIQKGREAAITEPRADLFHKQELSQAGQGDSEPKDQSFLQSGVNDAACSETRVKKKKKDKEDNESAEEERSQEELEVQHPAASVNEEITEEEEETPRLSQTINELELNEKNGMEESDIPDSHKKKKKKKRKNKSPAEGVCREVDGHTESDVRIREDSVHVGSCNRGKEKKKKDKEVNESAEEETSRSQAEPEVQHPPASVNEEITEDEETPRLSQTISELELNEKNGMEESDIPDSHKKKKKKKRKNKSPAEDEKTEKKKKTESSIDVEQLKSNTAAESLHDDVEILMKKKKRKKGTEKNNTFQDGGEDEGSEHAEAFQENFQETLESSHVKRKKHKEPSQKDVSNSPEDEENARKTKDGLEDHDAQLVTKKKKKKKKKMREMLSMESEDSVSVQEKEKKRTSSILIADVEGKAAQIEEKHSSLKSVGAEKPGISARGSGESAEITGCLKESNDRIKKKKKKKKTRAAQESVEKDQDLDFEELKGTCDEALSDRGVKKKKKRKRNESESVTHMEGSESAADAGCTDETVVLKKKRKKSMQVAPAAASEDAESESLFEDASPSLETPGSLARNDVGDEKKKKKGKSAHDVLLWNKSLMKTAEKKGHKTEKQEQKKATADSSFSSPLSKTSLSHFEQSSSHSVVKNKQKKLKRSLHNPSEDFLTDS